MIFTQTDDLLGDNKTRIPQFNQTLIEKTANLGCFVFIKKIGALCVYFKIEPDKLAENLRFLTVNQVRLGNTKLLEK